jgi:hypothetical protein
MILTAKDDWFPIQIEEYIKLVNCRTGVIWLGKAFDIEVLKAIFMISKTETRACRIQSSEKWLSFIDTCYSLGCVDNTHNWMAIDGLKQRFTEWMPKTEEQLDYFRFEERKFIDPIFCAVFDTQKQKRLIVDGLHRANALTTACKEDKIKSMPAITVVECYGDGVDIIYPCDIHQLPL